MKIFGEGLGEARGMGVIWARLWIEEGLGFYLKPHNLSNIYTRWKREGKDSIEPHTKNLLGFKRGYMEVQPWRTGVFDLTTHLTTTYEFFRHFLISNAQLLDICSKPSMARHPDTCLTPTESYRSITKHLKYSPICNIFTLENMKDRS